MPWGVWTYLLVVTRETVDSCIPMSSATSRRMSGFKCAVPLSKNSRWNLRIDSVTRTMVRWRCWIERISHWALRSFSWMYSRAFGPPASAVR